MLTKKKLAIQKTVDSKGKKNQVIGKTFSSQINRNPLDNI